MFVPRGATGVWVLPAGAGNSPARTVADTIRERLMEWEAFIRTVSSGWIDDKILSITVSVMDSKQMKWLFIAVHKDFLPTKKTRSRFDAFSAI